MKTVCEVDEHACAVSAAWLGAWARDFVCGRCTALLCGGVISARASFRSLVFRCACGALSRSR